jgi:hypothetical protein
MNRIVCSRRSKRSCIASTSCRESVGSPLLARLDAHVHDVDVRQLAVVDALGQLEQPVFAGRALAKLSSDGVAEPSRQTARRASRA